MKALILIAVAIFCLTACKTRNVSNTDISLKAHIASTEAIKTNTTTIDSATTDTHVKTLKNFNKSFEIDILPDTGKQQVINGNYTGKARKIVIMGSMLSKQTIDELIQENKAQITRSTLTDTIATKEDIKQDVKIKTTQSKGIYGWLFTVIGIILLCAVLLKIKKMY